MALRRKQIFPLDMALSGALGCLQPMASSLLNHCECLAPAEAVKRSRSHDFLQVQLYENLDFPKHSLLLSCETNTNCCCYVFSSLSINPPVSRTITVSFLHFP